MRREASSPLGRWVDRSGANTRRVEPERHQGGGLVRGVVVRLIATCLFAVLPRPAGAWREDPLAGIDAYAARVLREVETPGLSVAVVKDGRVVLTRGYGLRRRGEPAPVDESTLFGISSNTKAFTCAALALLAEEGKLAWDDPVTQHLPEFQMYDPWVTREVTLRDIVTHRTGLGVGAGDLMWWPSTTFTRQQIVRGLRHLKPAASLRSRYAYSNVMYVTAGEVVARASGRSWDDFVRERIFNALGMTRTTTRIAVEAENVAVPHVYVRGAVRPIAPMECGNVGAAGAINSTAGDMARWVRMLLECARAGQVPAGETCVLKPASIREMWSAQTVQGTPDPPKGLEALRANFAAYGLGFGLRDYRGRKLVSHTGGLPGYFSQVTLVPEERLSVVVLTNYEAEAGFGALTQRILDVYLGPPEPAVDWIAAFRAAAAERWAKAKEKVAEDATVRNASSSPSLPLERYVGRYRDPWYGEATIAVENGCLVLAMTRTPRMVADLEHWQYDTFVARWREVFMSDHAVAEAYVTFVLKPAATVERMTMIPVSPAIDFSFDFQDLRFTPVLVEPGGPAKP